MLDDLYTTKVIHEVLCEIVGIAVDFVCKVRHRVRVFDLPLRWNPLLLPCIIVLVEHSRSGGDIDGRVPLSNGGMGW